MKLVNRQKRSRRLDGYLATFARAPTTNRRLMPNAHPKSRVIVASLSHAYRRFGKAFGDNGVPLGSADDGVHESADRLGPSRHPLRSRRPLITPGRPRLSRPTSRRSPRASPAPASASRRSPLTRRRSIEFSKKECHGRRPRDGPSSALPRARLLVRCGCAGRRRVRALGPRRPRAWSRGLRRAD
jgi:hypothetical protein